MNLQWRQVASWSLYDFATSSYSAVIAAVIFPVYYVQVVVGNQDGRGDLWWGWAISLSMALVAISSPFLGGIADFGGWRKGFLLLYTALSVAAIAALSCLREGMALVGFLLIVLANLGMEGGLVFYNSFLPRIAPPSHRGRVSAWGYAVGYLGSILSLLLSLPLVRTGRFAVTWLMVACFFALFSLPAFLYLPSDQAAALPLQSAAVEGAKRTWKNLRKIAKDEGVRRFLLSYLLYEDGVNTVIVFSSVFAATTLGFSGPDLVYLYLLVQIFALLGAFVLARPTDIWGPKRVVTLSLLLWTAVVSSAFLVRTQGQFWMLSCLAGLGLGPIQAASRALFARLIPSGQEAEYFGVYSLVGKSSAILGPLLFGILSSSFGNQRPAILAVAALFLSGMIILVPLPEGSPPPRKEGEG